MIKSLRIEYFKGFEKYRIMFDRVNLLVGGNNCGKTTIFHAMNIFFWCMNQTADVGDSQVTFRKTQVPEVGAVPYFEARDLFYQQRTRTGRQPTKILLELETDAAPKLSFTIYPAFSRNLMIDGSDQGITRQQYDMLQKNNPVYVPGMIGVTVKEDLYREVAQDRMILEGRQSQVLRNLVYRLMQKPEEWKAFKGMVAPLFDLDDLDVPFDETHDEWLTATYNEKGCAFDLVSAGSGFLQVINLLSFLYLHSSRVALLDEPDSHMHDDLQRLTFDLLDRLSRERDVQLIIASHSPTFIDAAGLEQVRLIDRERPEPLTPQNVDTLVPMLGDRGIALPPAKVVNTLKSRRALFVEGKEADYEQFIAGIGEVLKPGFKALTRGMTVFETGGATKQWPFDAIKCFENLLGTQLAYVFLSDRDFFTDEEVKDRIRKAQEHEYSMGQLMRRHRESYLLVPSLLAKVLEQKWHSKWPNDALSEELGSDAIHKFLLAWASTQEDNTRTKFMVEHEPVLRGDAAHRSRETDKLNAYFRAAYTTPVGNREIPYKLLDAKQALKDLRGKIAEEYKISFHDKDILANMKPSDVPSDLCEIIDKVSSMFPDMRELQKRSDTNYPLFQGLD
ncbi:MAG: ATP-binding protein [Pirellulales bacterium]|nr:ATP-binding protein [Pirellulales bacterium]